MHRWNKVALVGVGLLGGSLGLALQQRRLARQVVGLVRRRASLAECRRLGVVSEVTLDPVQAATGADLIVLCTSISQMRSTLESLLPVLKRGAIVTDVGSVKGAVVQELAPLVARAGGHFVGSHPMAGTEKSGPGSAHSEMFANAICVVTPTRGTHPQAVRRIEDLWKAVGSRVLRLTPAAHDDLVARSSHLPHLVAAGLARYVLNPRRPSLQAALCATGFRDTTRIASSPTFMWRDIVLANSTKLSWSLGAFISDLQQLRRHLDKRDAHAIEKFLQLAKERRDTWCARKASPSPE